MPSRPCSLPCDTVAMSSTGRATRRRRRRRARVPPCSATYMRSSPLRRTRCATGLVEPARPVRGATRSRGEIGRGRRVVVARRRSWSYVGAVAWSPARAARVDVLSVVVELLLHAASARPRRRRATSERLQARRRGGIGRRLRGTGAAYACARHEVRGVRPRRLCRRTARRARRPHAARSRAHAAPAALAARGEVGRADVIPAGLPPGQRRRQHGDPRLRPGALPHRVARRSRPRRWASSSRPTRSRTAATS